MIAAVRQRSRERAPSGALFRLGGGLAAVVLVALPAVARAACPAVGPAPPAVVVTPAAPDVAEVERQPAELRPLAGGGALLANWAGAPTTLEPTLHAGLAPAGPAADGCWRLAQLEVRLVVTKARLVIPAEMPAGSCLERGALAAARAQHAAVLRAQHADWTASAGKMAAFAGELGWVRAGDLAEARAAAAAWILARRPALQVLAQAGADSTVPPPDPAEAERACPGHAAELRRFVAEQLARR